MTAIIPSLSKFSCLQVLSLTESIYITVPESIGCLKELRYLDVSYTKITQLPESVSRLYNLQTLLLLHCFALETLPEGMGSLASLRHLDITGNSSLLQMPKQMSKLKSLQTLTDFVVGKDGGSGIEELAELHHIRGKFVLRQLQNVATPKDALYANLRSKKFIEELKLEYDDDACDDSVKVKHVLDNLKPSESLQRLTIEKYPGTRFPSWLDPGCVVYAKLTHLCIKGCRNCSSLPPLGQLPSLQELEISDMEYMVRVTPEFYGDLNNSGLRCPFPVLEILQFKNMKKWEVWSKVDVKGNAVSFPLLRKLFLDDCPQLKGNLPIHVPSLTKIKISGCWELDGLLPRVPLLGGLEVTVANAIHLRSIIKLSLSGLVQLVDLPPEVAMLLSLRTLNIHECDNLKSLAKVELQCSLESLEISECEGLECLPKLSPLRNLFLSNCPRLRWNPGDSLPTSLAILDVKFCERWEFPIPMERMQHYTSLLHINLTKTSWYMLCFPLGVFPNLGFLNLQFCERLEKVYIPEGINLTSLYKLEIGDCPKLEMIGKETGRGEATILSAPNLAKLSILRCERVRPVLREVEGKILLPKLRSLVISKPNTITPLRFSQLADVTILYEEVECLPYPDQGLGSLPTTLTQLLIAECLKLRRVDGKALQTLTSLKEILILMCPTLESLAEEGLPPSLWRLHIQDCPKLERLPEEGMPPSLTHLVIKGCPILKERCEPEKGLYWPNVCDISQAFVYGTSSYSLSDVED